MISAEANELAAQLWRLRRSLEELRFRLHEQRLFELAELDGWKPRVQTDMEEAIEQVQFAQLAAAVLVSSTARAWKIHDEADLSVLVAEAPGVWREILADHRNALHRVVREFPEGAALESGEMRFASTIRAALGNITLLIGE